MRGVAVTGVQTCALPISLRIDLHGRRVQRVFLRAGLRCQKAGEAVYRHSQTRAKSQLDPGEIGRASCGKEVTARWPACHETKEKYLASVQARTTDRAAQACGA